MATGGSEATSNGVPGIPINTCDIHEDKILDMYCVIHDVVGCTSCMTKKHRYKFFRKLRSSVSKHLINMSQLALNNYVKCFKSWPFTRIKTTKE